MRRPETICLESLNPKVQGSIPCASTNLLCPRAAGRACGVPDVSRGSWQNAPRCVLTAYGFGKQPLERRRVRTDLNSVGGFLTALSCIAANRESPGCHQDVLQIAIAISYQRARVDLRCGIS
jgi:hypothetical protein